MSKFLKQNNKSKKVMSLSEGFTLVETLVALSIFTVSLLGIMSVLAGSISDTRYAKQKLVATYLAQEGIEYLRNQRDTAVLSGATSQAGWDDLFLNPLSPSSYPTTGEFVGFTRTINVDTTSFGSEQVGISSTVTWTQGSGPHNVIFSENLFNWVE